MRKRNRRRRNNKKMVVAIVLVIIVIAIAILLLVKSCGKEKDPLLEGSSTENTLEVVQTTKAPANDATTAVATAEATTTAASETQDVVKKATFVSLTANKSGLIDKGEYYELSVSVNEKDSNGDVYTSGSDNVKISKYASVVWYNENSEATTITLNEYLNKTDYIRIYRCDFNDNTIYSKNSSGYVVSFFDGIFQ